MTSGVYNFSSSGGGIDDVLPRGDPSSSSKGFPSVSRVYGADREVTLSETPYLSCQESGLDPRDRGDV